jgi:hypothetical protein
MLILARRDIRESIGIQLRQMWDYPLRLETVQILDLQLQDERGLPHWQLRFLDRLVFSVYVFVEL